jgi:hypothetical protein
MPFPDGHRVIIELTASSAQRIPSNSETGTILQLRGNVEVTMIVCRPTGNLCDKSPMVLHADGVDYNEKTGGIDPHGDVHMVLIDPVSKTIASK